MNHYSVYWIKEEFAYRYFHKSDILYRFLREFKYNPERIDLHSQFHFITNTFPKASLIAHVKNYKQDGVTVTMDGNLINLYKDQNTISLHIHEKHINFRCEILHDAEQLLFPMLRSFHPFLFIAGYDFDNYGWISPMRLEKFNMAGQVLYS